MKVYEQQEDGSYVLEGVWLSKAPDTAEVDAGLAVVQPYVELDEQAALERQWRNTELAKADIELNKVQDGRGTGLVSDWRDYRNELRDWPEHEGFPDSAFRPTFINSEV